MVENEVEKRGNNKIKVFDIKDLEKKLKGNYDNHYVVLIEGLTEIIENNKKDKLFIWFPVSKNFLNNYFILDSTLRFGITASQVLKEIDENRVINVNLCSSVKSGGVDVIALPENYDLSTGRSINGGFTYCIFEKPVGSKMLMEDYDLPYRYKLLFNFPNIYKAELYLKWRSDIF